MTQDEAEAAWPEKAAQGASGTLSRLGIGAGIWPRMRRYGLPILSIGGFYLLIVVFLSLTTPLFLSYTNVMNILANSAVLGIVALGQAFVIIGGGFDLSVSGTVPLGAVSFTLLVNANWDVLPAILVSILLGALIGLLNASIITKVGIDALVTTLATLSITRALAFIIADGVSIPFTSVDSAVLGRAPIGGVPHYVWAFLVIAVLCSLVLKYTAFGRMVYSVGGNRQASRLAGIRVDLTTAAVYVISGVLAAFGGVVVASQLQLGAATIGTQAALTSIAAVILGGASLTGGEGGILGTVLGVLVLGTLANGMALLHVPTFYQQMATGLMLLFAVGFGRLRYLLKLSS